MRFRLLAVFLALAVFGLFVVGYWRGSLAAVGEGTRQVVFVVQPGESVASIARRLKNRRLIKQPLVFRLYLRSSGLDGKIQAGKFVLVSSMSVPQIVETLRRGSFDVRVTIPEGLRVEEEAERLASALQRDWNYSDSDGNDSLTGPWIAWRNEFITKAKPYEGFLFPDTYSIARDATPEMVIEMMRQTFERRAGREIEAGSKKSGLSKKEIVVLASVVEREARFAKDRPMVADILRRRYQRGTLLGVDATLQYALGYSKKEGRWWREEITADDLELNSAYNTRKFVGLPPTPICNPGLASIRAVINPQANDYFYYVSDQTGKIYYAVTLDEHRANIARHLRQ
jgi:UPF0755 protein